MAEGQGHSVGTLYIDVVPRLNQAAMQQVAQQAQGAAGGRGGFGGGGTTVGGPGMPFPGGPGGGPVNNTVNTANSVYNYATSNAVNQAYNTVNNAQSYATTNAVTQNIVNNTYNRLPRPPAPRTQPLLNNRVIMQGMFGAFEVGRSATAFFGAGAEADLRGPTAGMRSYMHAADVASGGIYGAAVRGGIEFFEAATGRELAYGSPTAARRAIYEAEQSQLDVGARSDRMVATLKARNARAAGMAERVQMRVGNEYERSILGAEETADAAGREYRVGLLQRQRAMADAEGGEKIRAGKELERYVRDQMPLVVDAQRTAQVQKDAIKRDNRRKADAISSQVPSLMAAAEGSYGIASEREFLSGLAEDQTAADRVGGVVGLAQRGVNRLKKAARAYAQKFDARSAEIEAEAIGMEMGGDIAGAIRARGNRAIEVARKTAPPGYEDAYGRAEAAAMNKDLVKYFRGRNSDTLGLLSDRAVSGILASDTSIYGPTRAGAARIVSDAMADMTQLKNAGRFEDAALRGEIGINGLGALKANILRGVRAAGVSDLGAVDAFKSVGEKRDDDVTRLLEEISEGIKALNNAFR